jgi:hypothetical protein
MDGDVRVSLSDAWAEDIDDVTLTYMYRTYNRIIEAEAYRQWLTVKGEQDVAWAVKHEYEDRLRKQGGSKDCGGVF